MLTPQAKEHYLSDFSHYVKNGASAAPVWLRELREAAIADFEKLEFPTIRNEEWKYTSVEPITSFLFERPRDAKFSFPPDQLFAGSFTDEACNRLVFVNGLFSPELSSLRRLPEGVKIQSLAQALRESSGLVEKYLGRYARRQAHGFAALNTAFIEDGVFGLVPKGQTLEQPIYLIFATRHDRPVVSHPRSVFIFEASTEARIVETYIGSGGSAYFNNAVTEIVAEENANVEYYRLERETDRGFHVGMLAAQLGRNCNFTAHSITLGGSLVRNDVETALDGEGGSCILNGLYLVDGKQHVDNQTRIDHVRPHTTSFELYKGIVSGQARAVFNGKILVHKAAQKTDARQTNKNLVLSEDAVVNTKPQLEIYADDVKCSHGSTIGQLDSDALFYLRSRGIDRENAQSLLSYAFASDVVGRMKIGSMRTRLDDYLLNKFARRN